MSEEDCGFVIFSGSKLWYSSKDGIENSIYKPKVPRNVNKVRNSAKNKRDVKFQIFEDIMKLETDPFWISFFNDAAVGNLPRNFKFNNNFLSYHIRSKITNLTVPEDAETAISLIKNFLMETSGIQSPTDLRTKKIEEEKIISDMIDSEIVYWSQIRSEKQQSIAISLFVEKVGKYYNLNMNERKALMQNIKIGILAGYFNNDNIRMSGNQIAQINGLEYDEEGRRFCINKDICKVAKQPKRTYNDDTTFESSGNLDDDTLTNNSKKNLLKQWQKYILDINKRNKI